jgi:hypothetical protein
MRFTSRIRSLKFPTTIFYAYLNLFDSEFVEMSVIYFRTKFHVLSASGSSVTAVKPKARLTYGFHDHRIKTALSKL